MITTTKAHQCLNYGREIASPLVWSLALDLSVSWPARLYCNHGTFVAFSAWLLAVTELDDVVVVDSDFPIALGVFDVCFSCFSSFSSCWSCSCCLRKNSSSFRGSRLPGLKPSVPEDVFLFGQRHSSNQLGLRSVL